MDRREAVLQATLNLVTERGLYDTPMSEIAREARVAAGTIYHYFDSKHKLILDLYSEAKVKMGEALMEKYDGRAPYQTQFAQFWKNLFTFFIKNPTLFMFLEQFDNSPYYNKIAKEESKQLYLPVLDFIKTGIAEGILKDIEVELIANILNGTIAAVAKAHLHGDLSIDSAKLYKSIEISWHGLTR